MAATFEIDSVDDSELVVTRNLATRRRTGLVKGLSPANDGGSCSYILEQAYEAVRATHPLGVTYTGDDGNQVFGMILQQMTFRPINSQTCRVLMQYSSDLGLQPTVYLVENGSSISQIESDQLLGTATQLTMGWAELDGFSTVPKQPVRLKFFIPLRTIRISAMTYGRPSDDKMDLVGHVNSAPWCGRPAGHWLLKNYDVNYSRYAGYFQWQAEAMARPKGVDWSEYAKVKNPQTGQYVKVEQSDIDRVVAPAYSFGIISEGVRVGSGIMRVGPYRTTDFSSLFGFTTPPGSADTIKGLVPHAP